MVWFHCARACAARARARRRNTADTTTAPTSHAINTYVFGSDVAVALQTNDPNKIVPRI